MRPRADFLAWQEADLESLGLTEHDFDHLPEASFPIKPLTELIPLHEMVAGLVAPSRVVAVALNTRDIADDAEALRLGLVKMDEGMWSDPETGALVDRDDLDDRLDAEEDEADFQALTESENHSSTITDAEEAAWARTVQIANIAAGKRGAN